MSLAESNPEELYPYLNPEYWDGHMVADGQPTPPDPDSFTGPFGSSAANCFAKQTLRDQLDRMHTYMPIKTYNNGDTFDPEEWAIGTVALFDREILRTGTDTVFDPEPYASLQVPPRPTNLHPNLHPGNETIVHGGSDVGITYLRTMRWGIVTPTKQGRNAFMTTSTSDVWKEGAKPRVYFPFLPQEVPIKVGETKHTIFGDDRLTRVNILKICAIGSEQTEKRRASIFELFGRLATGNA